jgi:hypothetical protein
MVRWDVRVANFLRLNVLLQFHDNVAAVGVMMMVMTNNMTHTHHQPFELSNSIVIRLLLFDGSK